MKKALFSAFVLALLPCASVAQTLTNPVTPVGQTPVYRAAKSFSVGSAPYGVAILCGNNVSVTRLLSLSFSGVAATAVSLDVSVQKTSAATSGGIAVTAVPLNSSWGGANSVARYFPGNFTAPSTVGNIADFSYTLNPTTATTGSPIFLSFGGPVVSRAVVLHNTSECVLINLNGVTISSGVVSVTFEWTETPN